VGILLAVKVRIWFVVELLATAEVVMLLLVLFWSWLRYCTGIIKTGLVWLVPLLVVLVAEIVLLVEPMMLLLGTMIQFCLFICTGATQIVIRKKFWLDYYYHKILQTRNTQTWLLGAMVIGRFLRATEALVPEALPWLTIL